MESTNEPGSRYGTIIGLGFGTADVHYKKEEFKIPTIIFNIDEIDPVRWMEIASITSSFCHSPNDPASTDPGTWNFALLTQKGETSEITFGANFPEGEGNDELLGDFVDKSKTNLYAITIRFQWRTLMFIFENNGQLLTMNHSCLQ